MANEDILLTVGISLESIKKAKQQLISEIAQIKVPDVGGIDEKAMKATIRSLKEVAKESESIGKKIKKPEILNTNDVVLIRNAAKAFEAEGSSAFRTQEAMIKLGQTTNTYAEIAKREGVTLASVNAERKAYLATIGKGITLDAERATRLKEVDALSKKMAQSAQVQKQETPKAEEYMKANQQVANLAKNTAYYTEKNKIMGTTLNSVGSELNAYLKVEASGIQLTGTALAQKEKLTAQYAKLAKEQKGFFHGIDLPRLILWGIGWKLIYSVLNTIITAVANVGRAFIAVNGVIDTTRVVNQETAKSFDDLYSRVSKSIFATARGTSVAVEDIAKAFQTLTYEGAKVETSLKALAHVRDLMIITGEKELPVATAIIETYGLFKDKIKGANTESEKLAKITDLLATMFTKAHISMAEFQQIMGYIAPVGADVVESFDTLVSLLIFADEQMLQGRRGGMALSNAIIGLTQNANKLAEVFGIVFKPDELVTFESVVWKIREATKSLNNEARKAYLSKLFKGTDLANMLKLLEKSDDELKTYVENVKNVGVETAKAADRSKWMAISLKRSWEGTAAILKTVVDLSNKITYPIAKFLGAVPEELPKKTYERPNPKTDKYEKITEGEYNKIIEAQKKIVDLENKKIPPTITYTQALKGQLMLLDKQQQLALAEASGASFSYLQQEKMNMALEESVSFIADEEIKQKIVNELLLLKNATAKDIYDTFAKNIKASEYEKQILDATNKILEEKYALQVKIAEEIKTLADDLQSKTADYVKNLMSGTGNIKEFLNGITDSFRTTFADNLVQIFGEKSGIFSGMAGAFMSPIQKAHYSGGKSIAPLIIKAHVDGIVQGFSKVPSGGGGGDQFGSMTGFMGNVKGALGIQRQNAQTAQVSPMAAAGGATQVLVKPGAGQSKLAAAGRLGGQALGAAGAIYGGYQGVMAQRGQGAGTGMIGGALSGAMAGSMFGVWGIAIGAVIGGVMGAIQGKKKKETDPEVKQQTVEITSRLNISNRELQLANRNLEGIKRGVEMFAFARSAYFSENRAAEDFSADRSRGYIG